MLPSPCLIVCCTWCLASSDSACCIHVLSPAVRAKTVDFRFIKPYGSFPINFGPIDVHRRWICITNFALFVVGFSCWLKRTFANMHSHSCLETIHKGSVAVSVVQELNAVSVTDFLHFSFGSSAPHWTLLWRVLCAVNG